MTDAEFIQRTQTLSFAAALKILGVNEKHVLRHAQMAGVSVHDSANKGECLLYLLEVKKGKKK